MLKINGLTKSYGRSDVKAVDNLTLEINDGEIFGFIGPNGAGKSTTIKCVTGIIGFDSGNIEVNGYDVGKQPLEAKRSIGYVSDSHVIYDRLTGAEYVGFMASVYGVSDADGYKARLEKYLDIFNMRDVFNSPIKSYSHGMQQKIIMLMPFIFLAFCYNFPAALVLYWTVQNLFTILQQWLTHRYLKDAQPITLKH